MGRKATAGNRTKGGKKKKPTTVAARIDAARVLPTPETADYIQRRLNYWLVPGVWNLAAAEQCYDSAGILWATGWFDDHGFGPEEIRNIFRKYAEHYWRYYAELGPKVSRGERVEKGEPSDEAARWETWYRAVDDRLKGRERIALHELCVNGWHLDEVHHHAMALANLGRLRAAARSKQPIAIAGKVAADRGGAVEWLALALRGAFMLLDRKLAEVGDIPLWKLGKAA